MFVFVFAIVNKKQNNITFMPYGHASKSKKNI
jgi:hypothetical protein